MTTSNIAQPEPQEMEPESVQLLAEIPDRVSLEPESEFFFPGWARLGVRINGAESRSVIEFCVSEGWAQRAIYHGGKAKKGPNGRHQTRVTWGEIEPFWRS